MWQELCCVVVARNKVVANLGGMIFIARRHNTIQSGNNFVARTVRFAKIYEDFLEFSNIFWFF